MEKVASRNGQKPQKILYQHLRELLKGAAIGENVSLHIMGGETTTGILDGLSQEGVTLCTAGGKLFFPISQIMLIERGQPESTVMKEDAVRFLRETEALVQANNLSIPVQYADTFARLIPYSSNLDFIHLFQRRRARGILRLTPEQKRSILKELEQVCRRIGNLERDEIAAAQAFVHFAARDYTLGLEQLQKECLGTADQDGLYCLLPLACYCADMRKDSLAHYWLSRFFRHFPPLIDDEHGNLVDPVWVYYLKCAVAKNYYVDILPLLNALFCEHPKTALKSVAYMYLLQYAFGTGQTLLEKAADNSRMMTLDQFQMLCVHLPTSPFETEHYGSTYRFFMRMNEILSPEQPLYTSYTAAPDGDLMGFVYEYVPNTGYCRVLGFDTMVYFWHFDKNDLAEGNQSQHLRRAIEEQMCSILPVEEEKPVRVRFRATDGRYANQGFAVTDVQLE